MKAYLIVDDTGSPKQAHALFLVIGEEFEEFELCFEEFLFAGIDEKDGAFAEGKSDVFRIQECLRIL